MASEAQDSHKHRRSLDDGDADKAVKRHKHRHHHRHRHGSRKHGDESKPVADETVALALSPAPIAAGLPEDVEEGEILDDEASEGVLDKKPQSDADSAEAHDQCLNENLGVDRVNSCPEVNGEINGSLRDSSKDSGDEKLASNLGDKADKAYHTKSHRRDSRRKRGSVSPFRGNEEIYSYNDDGRSKLGNQVKSSSHSTGEKYKTVIHSPSHDKYHEQARYRSRSRSYDHVPEKSHSHSVREEEAISIRGRGPPDNKIAHDSEGTRRSGGRDNGDFPRDEERERSVHYSSRYGVDDRRRSREPRIREGSREKEQRERAKSRDREIERDWRRERERERSKEWDSDRERRREREQVRSKERDLDRKRRREGELYRSRDREVDRERNRENERDRGTYDRSRDREREKDRHFDRSLEQKQDDGYREKGRDKHENYDDDRDKYRRSRNSRHDERDYSKDESKKTGAPNSETADRFLTQRDEDEQEDQEEEQEEEDINRIKEASLRLRQAILEKYKNKQLEQKQGKEADFVVAEEERPGPSTAPSSSEQGVVDITVGESVSSVGKSPPGNGVEESGKGLGEGTPKSEGADDMFRDDIFGETPTGVRKSGKEDGIRVERSALHDNWDDAEGYYSHRFGELLDGRYEITAAHGKGVFSTVVRAKNIKNVDAEPEEVAIKIIRSNDTMYKAGMTELVILKKLVGQDPENKRHCVRFLSSFKYRNHLCLVFESLHMNLREVLKKFGRNIGLKLTAVRAYAKQLFIALKHLKNCGVLHCDIKPDNMLVNETKNVLKLCDFGNAMFAGKNEITPYLVSRFYRAPEIILGLPYDHPLDIWSVGCCLYELYTGKVLFPGATNNDMLRLHMELKGLFPKKMLRKGAFTEQNFDQDLNFHATEEDPVTKKLIKRIILNVKPKDISSIIVGSPGEDPKMLADFKDILDKMFVLDPDKRLTVSQALSHPFITGK